MDQSLGYIITILLGANTAVVGIAAALLFNRLNHQDQSIGRAHQRIDDHVGDHVVHTISVNQT